MDLTIETRDGVRILNVAGDLDTFGAPGFRDAVGPVKVADRYIVSLVEVSFVDSAGLHALFGVARVAKDVGATVAFVVPEENPVRRVVELVQLADVSPVCNSLEEAVDRVLDSQEGDGSRAPDGG